MDQENLPPESRVLDRYLDLYRNIQQADLTALPAILSADFRFRDPFNDFTGPENLVKLFEKTRTDVSDASFEIVDIWENTGTEPVIVKWVFSGRARFIGIVKFSGLSEISFDTSGLIAEHTDYWDSGEEIYARLPLISILVKMIGNRLKVS